MSPHLFILYLSIIENLRKMAASLYCPNCGEYHGKASENDESVYCGNCGETFENEYYEYYN